MNDKDFNPDRLITEPRTRGDVYNREDRRALITECCGWLLGLTAGSVRSVDGKHESSLPKRVRLIGALNMTRYSTSLERP